MIYDCLIRTLNWLKREKRRWRPSHQDLEQNHQGIASPTGNLKWNALPSASRHLPAGGSNLKRQKTHTPIQNDTHTLTVDLMNPPSNTSSIIAVNQKNWNQNRTLMLAKLVPFPPKLAEAQSRSWPWSDTFGCWNVEVTCHEGPLPPEKGSPCNLAKNPRPPSLDRLYKLTPFLRRGGWAVDSWRRRLRSEMEPVFPEHLRRDIPANISQEKNQIIIVGGKPPLKNIRTNKHLPINQPTNINILEKTFANNTDKILLNEISSPLFCCEEALKIL